MPIYHFNVHDGVQYRESKGSDLPDLAAARSEAVRRIAEILHEGAPDFWGGTPWHMDVSDAKELTLFRIMFLATPAPLAPVA
jgi:hypothetical protein